MVMHIHVPNCGEQSPAAFTVASLSDAHVFIEEVMVPKHVISSIL